MKHRAVPMAVVGIGTRVRFGLLVGSVVEERLGTFAGSGNGNVYLQYVVAPNRQYPNWACYKVYDERRIMWVQKL